MKIETHVHTRFSKDSLLCFLPLYIKCRICNISCIAITEHNNIDGGLKFKRFCQKRGNKIKVIVGEEVFSVDGEIIGLFLKENIKPGLSAAETINEIKKQNGLVYVPHPYDTKREKTVLVESEIRKNMADIDCMEVHNGRNVSKEFDIKQKAIAEKYKITPVIGSDAHTLIEIGRNTMKIEFIPEDRSAFIDVIKSAEFTEKECIGLAHTITKFAKAFKMIFGGDFKLLLLKIKKKIRK